jgi:hypothetical protein
MSNLIPAYTPDSLRRLAESPIAGYSANIKESLCWAAAEIERLAASNHGFRSTIATLRTEISLLAAERDQAEARIAREALEAESE